MKKLIAILAAGVFTVSAYAAPEIVRLDSREAAWYGASYVTIIEYDDLAAFTQTNGTHGITNAVPAKTGLTLAGAILETAFNDSIALGAAGAVTNSIILTVGDGSDADYFLASTEIAADGTEVFVQFSPVGSGTIVVTPQTTLIYPTGTTNAGPAVMTNATAAFTGARLGQKYYAAAGNVVYTFAGSGDTIPANLTQGRLKVYWRELK